MRATGIVRRIDDLGRVVIPRELRTTLNIKPGDSLEIFTEKGAVIFKKRKPYEVNYELMFQVIAAIYDVAGIYNQEGDLVRAGANYTLDVRIAANLTQISVLSNGCLLIPIVDSNGDTAALIAVDGKYAVDGKPTTDVETIVRLALATLTMEE